MYPKPGDRYAEGKERQWQLRRSAASAAVGDPSTTQPHLGEKHLTTLHAIGQALAIGPIFSVGLVSGLVANVAGHSTPATPASRGGSGAPPRSTSRSRTLRRDRELTRAASAD